MRYITILAIILLVLISGCGGGNKNLSDDYITVNVNKDYPEKELSFQDIGDVEYIALETTEDFITYGIVMDIGKEFIIVKNRINDGNLYIFDRKTGKAIRKINRLGQGGEEYAFIWKLTLDEERNELFICHAKKITVYDLFGNFKKSFDFAEADSEYISMSNYDPDNLIVYDDIGHGIIPDKQPHHLIISKQDGSITRDISIPTKGFKTMVIFGENDEKAFPIFYPTTPGLDNWILMNISSDTIYSYSTSGQIKPFMVRTPSIYSMDKEIFLFVEGVTDRYYLLHATRKELDKWGRFPVDRFVYDKQEDAVFKYTMRNADFLKERPFYWTASVNHDIATWYSLHASELTDAYQEGNLTGRLKEIAAELNEESNPVVMVVKHKK